MGYGRGAVAYFAFKAYQSPTPEISFRPHAFFLRTSVVEGPDDDRKPIIQSMKLRILLLIAAAILATSFLFWRTGTPELPCTSENLTGTWRLIREEGQELMYGRKSSWVIEYGAVEEAADTDAKDEPYYEIWEFGTDDVCVKTKGCNRKTLQTECYSYERSNDTVVVYGPSRQWQDRTNYRIEKLTASQLVLTETTDGAYGKVAWTLVYERMEARAALRKRF